MTIPAYVTGDRFVLESVSRQQSQALRLIGPAIVCRVLGKYLMFADADDFSVAPHLSLNGCWEPWTTLAIARALRPGARAVDVGANHGYFSLLMADAAGPDGRVLAVEPNPRLAELLARTFAVNGFTPQAAVLMRAAATSSGATVRLAIPAHRWADATVRRPPAPDEDAIDVETVSLDDATAEWDRVDLIKIDAEGSEEGIWDGMQQTLSRNPDVIVVMEFKCASYADAPALLTRIRAQGFPLRHVGDDGAVRELSEDEALHGRRSGDWVLFLSRR
jgi:FkbM family methyltransferase